MVEERVQRRLAAILATDVAGYSRLMGADEEGTLAQLKAHRREVIDPTIAAHNGRIVKTTGDGALVEFPSVVDAVRCAIEIQGEMMGRNADVPEDKRLAIRIGINVGDIIIEGEDIYGDGVNVAARLEALAEPGGICISRSTRDQIRDKLDLALEDMGDQTVKNIARPVRVFRIVSRAANEGGAQAAPATPQPERRSIAVLPFANMSGDPEQEYFADGMAEDIITSLSKISQLFVVARNSSFTFKGRAVHVQEASKRLGVRYILEGSVRKAGNRVRITAQLIDGVTGGHLWAERFDRELTDIFAVQDEVTQEIVSALALNLTKEPGRRPAREQTDSVEAYDHFLRGRDQWWQHTPAANAHARELLERAIELDPNFAPAHAFLAATHIHDYVNQWSASPPLSLECAQKFSLRAVALDDLYPYAHWALAITYLWQRQLDKSIAEAERAISLDPNFALGHVTLGFAFNYAGRFEEALACFDRGVALDPYYPDIYLHFQAQAHFHLGRFETAIGYLKRRLIRNPDSDISRVLLAASYGHLGRADEAKAAWQELLRVNPAYSLEHRRKVLPYKNPADFEFMVEGLRKTRLAH
jgi:adenylate cyclase